MLYCYEYSNYILGIILQITLLNPNIQHCRLTQSAPSFAKKPDVIQIKVPTPKGLDGVLTLGDFFDELDIALRKVKNSHNHMKIEINKESFYNAMQNCEPKFFQETILNAIKERHIKLPNPDAKAQIAEKFHNFLSGIIRRFKSSNTQKRLEYAYKHV